MLRRAATIAWGEGGRVCERKRGRESERDGEEQGKARLKREKMKEQANEKETERSWMQGAASSRVESCGGRAGPVTVITTPPLAIQ